MGVDMKTLKLRIGVFGAEPWSEKMRNEIESLLGIKALNIYGLSEIMGPGVAMECIEARQGMHLFEDHFLVETINPATGEVLPPGELLPWCQKLAAEIASCDRATLADVRRAINGGLETTLEAGMALEGRLSKAATLRMDHSKFAATREAVMSRGKEQSS